MSISKLIDSSSQFLITFNQLSLIPVTISLKNHLTSAIKNKITRISSNQLQNTSYDPTSSQKTHQKICFYFRIKNKMEVHKYLLICTITTILFYIYLRFLRKMKQSTIPGPLSLPFFGTKWQSIEMTKLHEYYDGLNKKYGDVVMEVSGNFPIISIFKRQDIEKILSSQSQYPFRPPNEIQSFYRMQNTDRYSSTGITNEQGPEWLKLRTKLSLKTLENRKFYAQYCSDLNEICSDFNDVIRSVRDDKNEIKNFHENMRSMSFETNCCFVLGKRGYGSLEGSEKITKLSNANVKIMEAIRDTYYGEYLLLLLFLFILPLLMIVRQCSIYGLLRNIPSI